jgi:hypothetical protein
MENVDTCGAMPASCHSITFPPRTSRVFRFRNRWFAVAASILLAAFLGSSAMADNPSSPEVKAGLAAHAPAAARAHRAPVRDDIPLLFLAIMGLGMLTLSHTRPSSKRAQQNGSLCAGKNVATGKELPENVAPRPGLVTH